MGDEPVAAKAALAASEPEIREPWLGSGFNQRFSRAFPKKRPRAILVNNEFRRSRRLSSMDSGMGGRGREHETASLLLKGPKRKEAAGPQRAGGFLIP